jgi:aurora kinase
VFLVLEYAPKGELFTAMRNSPGGRFTEARASIVMRQLCRALRRCHKFQVVHRDIKPENVLMGKNYEAKLADFGWSVNNRTTEDMKRETLCGTVDYVSRINTYIHTYIHTYKRTYI